MPIQKRASRKTTSSIHRTRPKLKKHRWSDPMPCSFAVSIRECKKCGFKVTQDYPGDMVPKYGCSS